MRGRKRNKLCEKVELPHSVCCSCIAAQEFVISSQQGRLWQSGGFANTSWFANEHQTLTKTVPLPCVDVDLQAESIKT